MKLIFVGEDLGVGETFSPREEDHAHLLKVLRLKRGDEVTASTGRRILRCVVERADRKVELRVAGVETLMDRRTLSLAISPIDSDRLAVAVSAAAQMASRDIIVVGCERAGRVRPSLERMRRVAMQAAKQVGCPFLPDIFQLADIAALLEHVRARKSYLLDPDATKTMLEQFPREPDSRGILLIIGPAGDFSDGEKEMMKDAGAEPVLLGDAVLRSETAAVAALGVAATCLRTGRS